MAGINISAAAPGMSRLAMALGGGGGGYQKGYEESLGLQSKIAQAMAAVQASEAAAAANRAKAKETEVETGITAGRGAVGDELLASEAGTDLPTLRAYRQQLSTGRPSMTSATGDAETDSMIGIKPEPVVSSAIAQALTKLAPRYAPYRTSTKDLKADDLAKARQLDREGDLSDSVIAGALPRNTVAGAQAAASGKAQYNSDATGAVLDLFAGSLDTSNPMAQGTIKLRGEQAGAQKANAAQSYASGRASDASARAADALAAQRKAVTAAGPSGGAGGKAPTGYRWTAGADGETRLEPIPGGPKDPSNNLGGSGKPMTEGQAKANIFGNRMLDSDALITDLEGKYSPAAVNAKMAAGEAPLIGGVAGPVANWLLSEEGQRAEQAQRDFINAVLRRESGAVISPQEFANAKQQYFPQPNDKPENIKQKKVNRQRATELMLQEVPEHHRKQKGAAPARASGALSPEEAQELEALRSRFGKGK